MVEMKGHLSDCATHNAPAMEKGVCDCGYDSQQEVAKLNKLEKDVAEYYELGVQEKALKAKKDPLNKGIKLVMSGDKMGTFETSELVAVFSVEERSNINEIKLLQKLKTLGFLNAIEMVERPNQAIVEQLIYEQKILPTDLVDCIEITPIEKLTVKKKKVEKPKATKNKEVKFHAEGDKSVF